MLSNVGVPGLILLIIVVAVVGGIIWLVVSASKRSGSAKEIAELKQRVDELEDKNQSDI